MKALNKINNDFNQSNLRSFLLEGSGYEGIFSKEFNKELNCCSNDVEQQNSVHNKEFGHPLEFAAFLQDYMDQLPERLRWITAINTQEMFQSYMHIALTPISDLMTYPDKFCTFCDFIQGAHAATYFQNMGIAKNGIYHLFVPYLVNVNMKLIRHPKLEEGKEFQQCLGNIEALLRYYSVTETESFYFQSAFRVNATRYTYDTSSPNDNIDHNHSREEKSTDDKAAMTNLIKFWDKISMQDTTDMDFVKPNLTSPELKGIITKIWADVLPWDWLADTLHSFINFRPRYGMNEANRKSAAIDQLFSIIANVSLLNPDPVFVNKILSKIEIDLLQLCKPVATLKSAWFWPILLTTMQNTYIATQVVEDGWLPILTTSAAPHVRHWDIILMTILSMSTVNAYRGKFMHSHIDKVQSIIFHGIHRILKLPDGEVSNYKIIKMPGQYRSVLENLVTDSTATDIIGALIINCLGPNQIVRNKHADLGLEKDMTEDKLEEEIQTVLNVSNDFWNLLEAIFNNVEPLTSHDSEKWALPIASFINGLTVTYVERVGIERMGRGAVKSCVFRRIPNGNDNVMGSYFADKDIEHWWYSVRLTQTEDERFVALVYPAIYEGLSNGDPNLRIVYESALSRLVELSPALLLTHSVSQVHGALAQPHMKERFEFGLRFFTNLQNLIMLRMPCAISPVVSIVSSSLNATEINKTIMCISILSNIYSLLPITDVNQDWCFDFLLDEPEKVKNIINRLQINFKTREALTQNDIELLPKCTKEVLECQPDVCHSAKGFAYAPIHPIGNIYLRSSDYTEEQNLVRKGEGKIIQRQKLHSSLFDRIPIPEEYNLTEIDDSEKKTQKKEIKECTNSNYFRDRIRSMTSDDSQLSLLLGSENVSISKLPLHSLFDYENFSQLLKWRYQAWDELVYLCTSSVFPNLLELILSLGSIGKWTDSHIEERELLKRITGLTRILIMNSTPKYRIHLLDIYCTWLRKLNNSEVFSQATKLAGIFVEFEPTAAVTLWNKFVQPISEHLKRAQTVAGDKLKFIPKDYTPPSIYLLGTTIAAHVCRRASENDLFSFTEDVELIVLIGYNHSNKLFYRRATKLLRRYVSGLTSTWALNTSVVPTKFLNEKNEGILNRTALYWGLPWWQLTNEILATNEGSVRNDESIISDWYKLQWREPSSVMILHAMRFLFRTVVYACRLFREGIRQSCDSETSLKEVFETYFKETTINRGWLENSNTVPISPYHGEVSDESLRESITSAIQTTGWFSAGMKFVMEQLHIIEEPNYEEVETEFLSILFTNDARLTFFDFEGNTKDSDTKMYLQDALKSSKLPKLAPIKNRWDIISSCQAAKEITANQLTIYLRVVYLQRQWPKALSALWQGAAFISPSKGLNLESWKIQQRQKPLTWENPAIKKNHIFSFFSFHLLMVLEMGTVLSAYQKDGKAVNLFWFSAKSSSSPEPSMAPEFKQSVLPSANSMPWKQGALTSGQGDEKLALRWLVAMNSIINPYASVKNKINYQFEGTFYSEPAQLLMPWHSQSLYKHYGNESGPRVFWLETMLHQVWKNMHTVDSQNVGLPCGGARRLLMGASLALSFSPDVELREWAYESVCYVGTGVDYYRKDLMARAIWEILPQNNFLISGNCPKTRGRKRKRENVNNLDKTDGITSSLSKDSIISSKRQWGSKDALLKSDLNSSSFEEDEYVEDTIFVSESNNRDNLSQNSSNASSTNIEDRLDLGTEDEEIVASLIQNDMEENLVTTLRTSEFALPNNKKRNEEGSVAISTNSKKNSAVLSPLASLKSTSSLKRAASQDGTNLMRALSSADAFGHSPNRRLSGNTTSALFRTRTVDGENSHLQSIFHKLSERSTSSVLEKTLSSTKIDNDGLNEIHGKILVAESEAKLLGFVECMTGLMGLTYLCYDDHFSLSLILYSLDAILRAKQATTVSKDAVMSVFKALVHSRSGAFIRRTHCQYGELQTLDKHSINCDYPWNLETDHPFDYKLDNLNDPSLFYQFVLKPHLDIFHSAFSTSTEMIYGKKSYPGLALTSFHSSMLCTSLITAVMAHFPRPTINLDQTNDNIFDKPKFVSVWDPNPPYNKKWDDWYSSSSIRSSLIKSWNLYSDFYKGVPDLECELSTSLNKLIEGHFTQLSSGTQSPVHMNLNVCGLVTLYSSIYSVDETSDLIGDYSLMLHKSFKKIVSKNFDDWNCMNLLLDHFLILNHDQIRVHGGKSVYPPNFRSIEHEITKSESFWSSNTTTPSVPTQSNFVVFDALLCTMRNFYQEEGAELKKEERKQRLLQFVKHETHMVDHWGSFVKEAVKEEDYDPVSTIEDCLNKYNFNFFETLLILKLETWSFVPVKEAEYACTFIELWIGFIRNSLSHDQFLKCFNATSKLFTRVLNKLTVNSEYTAYLESVLPWMVQPHHPRIGHIFYGTEYKNNEFFHLNEKEYVTKMTEAMTILTDFFLRPVHELQEKRSKNKTLDESSPLKQADCGTITDEPTTIGLISDDEDTNTNKKKKSKQKKTRLPTSSQDINKRIQCLSVLYIENPSTALQVIEPWLDILLLEIGATGAIGTRDVTTFFIGFLIDTAQHHIIYPSLKNIAQNIVNKLLSFIIDKMRFVTPILHSDMAPLRGQNKPPHILEAESINHIILPIYWLKTPRALPMELRDKLTSTTLDFAVSLCRHPDAYLYLAGRRLLGWVGNIPRVGTGVFAKKGELDNNYREWKIPDKLAERCINMVQSEHKNNENETKETKDPCLLHSPDRAVLLKCLMIYLVDRHPDVRKVAREGLETFVKGATTEECIRLRDIFFRLAGCPFQSNNRSHVQRMGGILGLKALIGANPRNVPDWIPKTVTKFSEYGNQKAQDAEKREVQDTLQTFFATHQEGWNEVHKAKFTREQLEIIDTYKGQPVYFS